MKFKAPETLEGLSIEELDALRLEAHTESVEINSISDDDFTDENLSDLEALNGHVDAIDQQRTALTQAAAEKAERLAAARGKVAEAAAPAEEPEPEDGGDGGSDDNGDDEIAVDVPEDASELIESEERELVTASAASRPAGTKRSVVAAAAGKTPSPDVPIEKGGTVLVAAANLPGGKDLRSTFSSMSELSSTWLQRESKSPMAGARTDIADTRPVMTLSKNHVRQSFARIVKPELDFALGEKDSVQAQLEMIDAAANERKRFGSRGLAEAALTAAGGWCAPSETVYDFCSYETVSGILDIPTVQIKHGGINFTQGPSYSALAATWGFQQTEAQAEAGTTKTCYEVECPPFADHRMDVIGFCVTSGVLTASPAGYPELIRRVLEIGTVAHAHKVNADTIGRISTLIGTAVNYVEVGGASNDILDAVGLQATRLRYQLAMDPNATIEGIAPLWLLDVFRADLGRRTGVDMLAVSDADVQRYLAARKVRLQFVYDYQPLATTNTGTWTALPTTVEIMLYPAGAFVRGTSNVIDLDTIYDSVGLSTNSYTAAFFEEGQMVFNRCGFGVKVEIAFGAPQGLSGAANIGAA